ncbi:MAG: hypothetical protein WD024_06820 [Bacillota bacterium]
MGGPTPQVKKGYIRGVVGLVITALQASGAAQDPAATPYGIRTSPQVGVSVVSEGGAASVLRGGDQVLAYVKDPDTIVAVNLAVQNARLDGKALQVMAGGALKADAGNAITGWTHPTIAEQQNPPCFRVDVYAKSLGAHGEIEGYVKYTFVYCRATTGNETLQDKTFTVPELKVECFENPSTGLSVYSKEIVAALPAELTA